MRFGFLIGALASVVILPGFFFPVAAALASDVLSVGAGAVNAPSPSDSSASPTTLADIKIEEPAKRDSSAYDQLLTLQAGYLRPRSISFSNGSYGFNYGNQLAAPMGELAWAIRLLDAGAGGSFYLEEGVAFSAFSGDPSQDANLHLTSSSYSLYLLGLDSRLMYAADWFPVKWLVPFADGGYQYTGYYQSSSAGAESAEGSAGNFVAGGGMRVWLNRKGSIQRGNTPIFLSAKYNRIFESGNSVDLASSTVLGGLSLGF